jgi:hypothetical protein
MIAIDDDYYPRVGSVAVDTERSDGIPLDNYRKYNSTPYETGRSTSTPAGSDRWKLEVIHHWEW